jgi:hypothetical protein
VFARPFRRQLFIVSGICLLVFAAWQTLVFPALKVVPGSPAEALSVPLQQLARIARDHQDELTTKERQAISRVFGGQSPEAMAKRYDPRLSNPVKDYFDRQWFSAHRADFLHSWLALVARFPASAGAAFIAGNYGYWWPGAQYWISSDRIYPNQLGLAARPRGQRILPRELWYAKKTKDYAQESHTWRWYLNPRNLPVLTLLWRPGTAFWVLLASAIAFIAGQKRRRQEQPESRPTQLLLAFLPAGLLWLTCLASPVFAEFRYVYALFLCAPTLLWLGLSRPTRKLASSSTQQASQNSSGSE